MQGNKPSLNVSKTQSMLVCTKPKHQKLRTAGDSLCSNIRGKDLDVVQKVKYLRVQVDNSLGWKEKIKVISSKVSKAKMSSKARENVSLRVFFKITLKHS